MNEKIRVAVPPTGSTTNDIVKMDNICLTKACVKASSNILDRIDTSIDPCEDFYQFSCGKFLQNAVIADDMTAENIISTVNMKIRHQLQLLLMEEAKPAELHAFKLAKTYYKSCMDTETIERAGVKGLTDLVESYGGWPVVKGSEWREDQWNWIEVQKQMFIDGVNQWLLFEVDIMPSFVNSTANRVYVSSKIVHFSISHKYTFFPNNSVEEPQKIGD